MATAFPDGSVTWAVINSWKGWTGLQIPQILIQLDVGIQCLETPIQQIHPTPADGPCQVASLCMPGLLLIFCDSMDLEHRLCPG